MNLEGKVIQSYESMFDGAVVMIVFTDKTALKVSTKINRIHNDRWTAIQLEMIE